MIDYPLRTIFLVLIVLPIILMSLSRRKERLVEKERKTFINLMKKEYGLLDKKNQRGSIGITIKLEENEHFKFVLTNNGNVVLRNIEMQLQLEAHHPNPLFVKEYQKKFPLSRLSVGEEVTLDATQYPASPKVYNIRVRWTEPGDVRVEDQISIKYQQVLHEIIN